MSETWWYWCTDLTDDDVAAVMRRRILELESLLHCFYCSDDSCDVIVVVADSALDRDPTILDYVASEGLEKVHHVHTRKPPQKSWWWWWATAEHKEHDTSHFAVVVAAVTTATSTDTSTVSSQLVQIIRKWSRTWDGGIRYPLPWSWFIIFFIGCQRYERWQKIVMVDRIVIRFSLRHSDEPSPLFHIRRPFE